MVMVGQYRARRMIQVRNKGKKAGEGELERKRWEKGGRERACLFFFFTHDVTYLYYLNIHQSNLFTYS